MNKREYTGIDTQINNRKETANKNWIQAWRNEGLMNRGIFINIHDWQGKDALGDS